MMLYKINKIIFEFIKSLDDLTNEDLISLNSKVNTLISENLERGHITSNACLVAGNTLKTNPRELRYPYPFSWVNITISLFSKIK